MTIIIVAVLVAAALVVGYLFHRNNPKKDAKIESVVKQAETKAQDVIKKL